VVSNAVVSGEYEQLAFYDVVSDACILVSSKKIVFLECILNALIHPYALMFLP